MGGENKTKEDKFPIENQNQILDLLFIIDFL